MKKGMKILSFALVAMMVLSMTVVFATYNDLKFNANDQGTGAGDTAAVILGFVQFIGYAIAVGMLIYVGIKYVMASADEKANLKNAMIRYVIGAVLIAGATTIATWVFNLGTNV